MGKFWRQLHEDISAVFTRDPAARSRAEVILTYPGIHALIFYRMANWLWHHRLKLLAKLLAHKARWLTGIEIHPGATIGRRLFIDHGMGVVIGETAEIGDDVTLYHGVTLGGTSMSHGKRHPTLEDHVVIGAGAKVLGPVVIGHHTRIGAGSVVVSDVPSDSTVVGVPGRVVARRGVQNDAQTLEHGNLPDPAHLDLEKLTQELSQLKAELHALKNQRS